MPTKVFFCEPVGESRVTRRYECVRGHSRKVDLGRFAEDDQPKVDWNESQTCPECGEPAKLASEARSPIFRRSDSGDEVAARDLPPGAVYDEKHYHDWRTGPDGRSLVVVLPTGRHWFVDDEASN